jgi:hypothetical protein
MFGSMRSLEELDKNVGKWYKNKVGNNIALLHILGFEHIQNVHWGSDFAITYQLFITGKGANTFRVTLGSFDLLWSGSIETKDVPPDIQAKSLLIGKENIKKMRLLTSVDLDEVLQADFIRGV